MADFGKILVIFGVGLVVLGAVLMVIGRTNLPIGRLPGDILYRGKNTTVYFPLATSLLVSLVLSIVLYLVGRWRR
jgi:ABC-type Na+ efflux pump permease subunit